MLKIFESIENYLQYFKAYYKYSKNYRYASEMLTEIKNNKKTTDILAKLMKGYEFRGLDLSAFLVKPI